jgi:hypothetical protein
VTDPDDLQERVAALEAAVRELNDRLDNPGRYIAAAEVARMAELDGFAPKGDPPVPSDDRILA